MKKSSASIKFRTASPIHLTGGMRPLSMTRRELLEFAGAATSMGLLGAWGGWPLAAHAAVPGTPNPDPYDIVVAPDAATITVYPTGVAHNPGGRTDTDNLQWAVDNIALGGTVLLMDTSRAGVPTSFTLGKDPGTAYSATDRPKGKVGWNGTTFSEYDDEWAYGIGMAADNYGSLEWTDLTKWLGDLKALARAVRISRRCTVRGNGVDADGHPRTKLTLGVPNRFDEFVAIDKLSFHGAYGWIPISQRIRRKSERIVHDPDPNPECPYDYVAYVLLENDFVTMEDLCFDRMTGCCLIIMHPCHLNGLRFNKCGQFTVNMDIDPLSIYPIANGQLDLTRGTRTIIENCTSYSYGCLINGFNSETTIRNNHFVQQQGTHWILNGWIGIGAHTWENHLPEFCCNRELVGNVLEGIPQTPSWSNGISFSTGGVLVRGSTVTVAHVTGVVIADNTVRNLPNNFIIQENWDSAHAGSTEVMENVVVARNRFHNCAGNTFNAYTQDFGAHEYPGNQRIVNIAVTDNVVSYDTACPIWNRFGLPDIWIEHCFDARVAKNRIEGKRPDLNYRFASVTIGTGTERCSVEGNWFSDINSYAAIEVDSSARVDLFMNKFAQSGLPGWAGGAGCVLLNGAANCSVKEDSFPASSDRCDQVMDIDGWQNMVEGAPNGLCVVKPEIMVRKDELKALRDERKITQEDKQGDLGTGWPGRVRRM